MGKAAYGALMGLGQGISQWGNQMAADTLSKQAEQREFDRQQSLLEISQRYQQTQLKETRLYAEGQRDEERTYQERIKGEDRDYGLQAATPGTPEYEARQLLQAEELANQKALRAVPFGGSGSGVNLLSQYNQANFTPESWHPWAQEVGRLINEEDMDPPMAALQANQQFQLVQNKDSSPAGETAVNKNIMKDFKAFKVANPTVEDMRFALIDMGVPEADVSEKSRKELIDIAKGIIASDYSSFQQAPPPAQGLMNNPPPPENKGVMPGQAPPPMGQPGSSEDNPLKVGPNDPEPPPGTWFQKPDGFVYLAR